jgi:LEA14-like dessication related protein
MKGNVLVLFFLIAVAGSNGCALGLGKSLHELAYLDTVYVPKGKKAREIQSKDTDNVILSLTFDTDFADRAYEQLLAQCKRGSIYNIRGVYSTDLGFMAYKQILRLEAICIE